MTVPGRCSLHADQLAKFECLPCQRFACFLCARRLSQEKPEFACVKCGGLLTPPGKLVAAVKQAAPVTANLIEAPTYLTKRSVLTMLGVFAVVAALLRMIPGGGAGIIGLVLAGIEAAFFFRILETTADGEDELEMFDFGSAKQEIVHPFFVYLAAAVPMIAGLIWFGVQAFQSPLDGVTVGALDPRLIFHFAGPALLFIVGVLLWPLLLIGGSLGKSVIQTLNPANWTRTLSRMGTDYWVGAGAFYAVCVVQVFAVTPIVLLIAFKIPFAGPILATFIGYLAMALKARVLGLACRPHM